MNQHCENDSREKHASHRDQQEWRSRIRKDLEEVKRRQSGWRRDRQRDQEIEVHEKKKQKSKQRTNGINYFLVSRNIHPCEEQNHINNSCNSWQARRSTLRKVQGSERKPLFPSWRLVNNLLTKCLLYWVFKHTNKMCVLSKVRFPKSKA